MWDLVSLITCIAVAVGFRRFLYKPEERRIEDYRAVVTISIIIWYIAWWAGWI
jgi:hypothetical protein